MNNLRLYGNWKTLPLRLIFPFSSPVVAPAAPWRRKERGNWYSQGKQQGGAFLKQEDVKESPPTWCCWPPLFKHWATLELPKVLLNEKDLKSTNILSPIYHFDGLCLASRRKKKEPVSGNHGSVSVCPCPEQTTTSLAHIESTPGLGGVGRGVVGVHYVLGDMAGADWQTGLAHEGSSVRWQRIEQWLGSCRAR